MHLARKRIGQLRVQKFRVRVSRVRQRRNDIAALADRALARA
jgi:hypothetical protein